jgi:16S rRNA (uracil1498-N3)-methyltransferase
MAKTGDCKEKHEFALFVENLSSMVQSVDNGFILSDEKLIHRMTHVLRLQSGDRCIFFDKYIHADVIIDAIEKKRISCVIQDTKKNISLQPQITFLLPVLKRDDYEAALYSMAEMGVSTIQLVFTHKTAHQWIEGKDRERAQRILIGAAEQSKNFMYPELKEPIALEAALQKYDATAVKIFFDPQGKAFFDVVQQVMQTKVVRQVVLLIGPEGDLTGEEKKKVRVADFTFCALTPTVVRAVQAATLGAGFIRSLFFDYC